MNERIQELWNKAAEDTAAYPSGQNNSWETQVNFMNKFAELIVGECIRLCDQVDIVGADECIDNIRQHFGVEQ